jgi:hypothetical protein
MLSFEVAFQGMKCAGEYGNRSMLMDIFQKY